MRYIEVATFNHQERCVKKHDINNILFKYQMKKFSNEHLRVTSPIYCTDQLTGLFTLSLPKSYGFMGGN